MWRWVAIASLLYGLLVMAAVANPPKPGQRGNLPGPPPDLHPLIDFETNSPPFHTRPANSAEVVAKPDGNHLLRWEIGRGRELVNALTIQIPPRQAISRIRFEVSSTDETELVVGLRERDGSIYGRGIKVSPGHQIAEITVDELHLLEFTNDENGVFDPAQADGLSFAHSASLPPQRQAPIKSVEIDNIKLVK